MQRTPSATHPPVQGVRPVDACYKRFRRLVAGRGFRLALATLIFAAALFRFWTPYTPGSHLRHQPESWRIAFN
jgi:hypothetical protein